MGSVIRRRKTAYPHSLVKSIMQYSKPNSHIPALKWGREKEEMARQRYISIVSPKHTNFQVHSAGFRVDVHNPFLSATPDGMVSLTAVATVYWKSSVHLNTDF